MDKFRLLSRLILLTCVCTFIVGCLGGCAENSAVQPTLLPQQIPLSTTPCAVTELSNFYSSFSEPVDYEEHLISEKIDQVFLDFLEEVKTPGEEMQTIKGRATNLLTYETIRWSYVWEKTIDNKNKIRIIFTFVSPDLIRAVILNHLMLRISGESNPDTNIKVNEYTDKVLKKMDEQAKFLLLIAIQPETSNKSDSQIVIPPNISLNNVANSPTYKIGSDDFLHHPINFSDGQRAGIILFPFGITNPATGSCVPVLNPNRDTSITFAITGAQIAGEKEEIFAEIPLSPAIPIIASELPPQNPYILHGQGEYIPYPNLPPIPTPDPNGVRKDGDLMYWTLVSLFVWQKLTLDYFGFR